MSFGYQELLIVLAIGLLLFGSARLPSLMRSMGRSINEFKAGMKDKPADPEPRLDNDPLDIANDERAEQEKVQA